MRKIAFVTALWLWTLTPSAVAATLYNNLTPTNAIAVASRVGTSGVVEIEAADDFIFSSRALINQITFTGLIVPGTEGSSAVAQVIAEIYRVFPADSNTVRVPNVPTRVNSPSDVALDSRDSGSGGVTVVSTVLNASFTALNSVKPGGIHPLPNQTTGGNGPITGQQVQITLTLASPFNLLADHFFFVPQVRVTNGGQFYWLSASRPISGAGTTPFAPDLQAWVRDGDLDPDWLRVGTDIVGGSPAPTFNLSFALDGSLVADGGVPEPASLGMVAAGLGLALASRRKR
jgi:PEP-CTERM motif